jgi:hypothetical protein
MKTILSILLFIPLASFSCDHCNVLLNVPPNDFRNSVDLMFRSRDMFGSYNAFGEMITTRHAGHGNDLALWGNDVSETYRTMELRGNFYFFDKWRTTIIIPYVFNTQNIDDAVRYRVNAVGDPVLLQSYLIYNSMGDTAKQVFTQRWIVGAGLRAPLGETQLSYDNGTPNLDLQPGSGAWGALVYTTFTFKYKWLGWRNNISFLHNGQDNLYYQYGQTFNWNSNLFADIPIGKQTLRLLGGIYHESAKMDKTRSVGSEPGLIHNNTGGKIWFAQTGIRIFTKNMQFFGTYEHAVKCNLNGFEQLLTRNTFNLGATWYF